MSKLKLSLTGLLAAALVVLQAADKVAPIHQTRRSVAIEGYDPVAYFTDGKPVKGKTHLAPVTRGPTGCG